MINKLYRIWDESTKSYVEETDNLDSYLTFELKDGSLNVKHADSIVLEKCVMYLQDLDSYLYEGDTIFVFDIFGELVNYYTIKDENGVWYCNNDEEEIMLCDILKSYTIQIIGSNKAMVSEGMRVYKNICTECLVQNIIIQPTNATSFFCVACGCLY